MRAAAVRTQRMSGTLKGMWKNPLPVDDRVLHYLTKVSIHPTSGCWLWPGRKMTNGYARVVIYRKDRLLHRLVYELLNGALDEGLSLHHTCETPACVNPQHLEPCTHSEHRARHGGYEKLAAASARTRRERSHCAKGHEYTPENTIVSPGSWRKCRICDNARRRERYAWRRLNG